MLVEAANDRSKSKTVATMYMSSEVYDIAQYVIAASNLRKALYQSSDFCGVEVVDGSYCMLKKGEHEKRLANVSTTEIYRHQKLRRLRNVISFMEVLGLTAKNVTNDYGVSN